jgi:thioredoxin 1
MISFFVVCFIFRRKTMPLRLFLNPCLVLFAMVLLLPSLCPAEDAVRVSEKYPDLAKGVLTEALLQDLPDHVLVTVNGKEITREMLAQKVDGLSEEMKTGASNFYFYLLEDMVEQPILLTRVLPKGNLPEANEDIQQFFKDYINNVVAGVEVSEADALAFFESHADMFGEMAFEEVKDEIMAKILEQRQQKAWDAHVRQIGLEVAIGVNESWVSEQAAKVTDNAVDKARKAEKPLLVVFTAEWCPACKELTPVLESIQAGDTQDVTILVVDVVKDGLLAARYEVSAIPLLLFFDKEGNEVEQYTGFISEDNLNAKLKALASAKAE